MPGGFRPSGRPVVWIITGWEPVVFELRVVGLVPGEVHRRNDLERSVEVGAPRVVSGRMAERSGLFGELCLWRCPLGTDTALHRRWRHR